MAYRKPLVHLVGNDLQQLPVADRLNLGVLSVGPIGPTLTVTGNAVTITTSFHAVNSTSSTASVRQIHNVLGGQAGDIVIFKVATGSNTVVLVDNTGNLKLAGNFSLDALYDSIVLLFDGTKWIELCRSNNGD